jgi:glycosyltransferase involved in cell wall biosynthesis
MPSSGSSAKGSFGTSCKRSPRALASCKTSASSASASRREPCALVYIEAALSRKPCIACRSGGAPESIEDGQTGLLVPTKDSRAIAEALLTLLTNRDRASKMGLAAYERAVGVFGWDRFIYTLEQVYERVLDERSRGAGIPVCQQNKRPAA